MTATCTAKYLYLWPNHQPNQIAKLQTYQWLHCKSCIKPCTHDGSNGCMWL